MHALGEGSGLPIRGSRGHDHAIEEGGHGGGVKDLNVLGLDILKGIDNQVLKGLDVQGWSFRGSAQAYSRCSEI